MIHVLLGMAATATAAFGLASSSSTVAAPLEDTKTASVSADVDEDEVRRGIDWIVLPIFQFNDDAGFVYGIHFPLADYGDGTGPEPYRWAIELKLRHSTRNRHEHFMWLDVRDVFGLRLTARGTFLRIADANYFGETWAEVLPEPMLKRFNYLLTEPRLQLLASRRIFGDFGWGLGLSVSATSTEYAADSVLAHDRPLGIDGGHALILLGSLAYDTRDDEMVPTKGAFAELYAKAAPSWLGSSFGFYGAGLTAQGYLTPISRLVFAERVMAETLGGDVPFYELGRIGGRTNVFGLGGVFTQRGFLESRFLGRTKVLSNTEARYYFPPLFRRRLTLGLGAFFDASMVLDELARDALGDRIRPSGGGEVIVKWKELVLFRVDVGASAEGTLFYIEGRHLF